MTDDSLVPAADPLNDQVIRPAYRILIHDQFANYWEQLVSRVGSDIARGIWGHITVSPTALNSDSITVLRGKAGDPISAGWSKTHLYEVPNKVAITFQYNKGYRLSAEGKAVPSVVVRTIDYTV
ncbi:MULTISPECIES: hypothetical protein [unclassified Rathayibacter]|uniref:hypothetical protein n=1 Tax=unclassified Rathayibacter TaxID=2609250 RepID=UPI0011B0830B|nr:MULTISPECIES: hypothetical protein [unclassified Rathayibacter]